MIYSTNYTFIGISEESTVELLRVIKLQESAIYELFLICIEYIITK